MYCCFVSASEQLRAANKALEDHFAICPAKCGDVYGWHQGSECPEGSRLFRVTVLQENAFPGEPCKKEAKWSIRAWGSGINETEYSCTEHVGPMLGCSPRYTIFPYPGA